ncbi:MAG: glutamyl-tRNA reductase [Acidimicrobiales bacterium]|nr:glutamyl-tRNA reductase [Acidimicrobiales bacterium]MDG1875921.1 glutamyl-tRNA reductase [Acidimicrobiales bacterium]
MSIVAIGCNHRSTPLAVLERMTIAADDIPKALADLGSADNLSEVVVLSTCNRVEIYAYAERFHGGYQDIREFIGRHAGLAPEDIADHLYALHDAEAVRHLFSVTAGLDSAVVGEHEILGQVRTAWDRSSEHGNVGSVLGPLFRHALETGKRARTDTAIGRGIASVSQAAVALAADHLDGLEGRTVLVLGAGEMAEGTVKSLAAAGTSDIFVANRTWENAVRLAEVCGGTAVGLEQVPDALVAIDVLVTTTGAQDIIFELVDVVDVITRRTGRELVIVDVAVPRDVDPAATDLDGVVLLNMDDIGAFVDQQMTTRTRVVGNVESIVDEEVNRYQVVTSAREVAPLVSQLRTRGSEIADGELARFAAKLADLELAEREAVEAMAKGIVNKLLHEPTVRLKDAAGHAKGDRLAESLRDLFDL